MEDARHNRRREQRFEIGGYAVLRAEAGGESYAATVLNVSGAGLFLRLDSHPFQVGDEVVCEIKLPERPKQPLASWGLGKIVRMDPTGVAIELDRATFDLGH
jgi:Tfp pilus assembly protein PilZ